jgi:putative heme-binding domain-containing protein
MLGDDPGLRPALLQAVERLRLTEAGPRLVRLLTDANRPETERLAVLKTLRVLKEKSAIAFLKDVLHRGTPSESVSFQIEALRTLAALEDAAGQEAARKLLDRKDGKLQSEAVQILGAHADGAKLVGERFLAKRLPPELLPSVTDALRRHATRQPALAKLLTEVMKGGLLVSLDKAEVERVRQLVGTKGHPERGRALYLNHRVLACVTCHCLEGIGGNVGPDLTRIWDTQSVEKIMESILDPSKEIKEGYQTYVATTAKGQVFSGLKVSQTAQELVLRDANAKEIHIPVKELEEVKASPQSLMPDNVVAQLTFDQFVDLVAFLKDRAAQESLQGIATDFRVVGPFGGNLNAVEPPEQNPDPLATYPAGKDGTKRTWQPGHTEPNGMLNLTGWISQKDTSAYALTNVYSPKAQKVRLWIGSDDPVKVWLQGTVVYQYASPRNAAPDQDQVEVAVQEGWNPVLVKVVHGGLQHRLYLRLTGGQGVRMSRGAAMK